MRFRFVLHFWNSNFFYLCEGDWWNGQRIRFVDEALSKNNSGLQANPLSLYGCIKFGFVGLSWLNKWISQTETTSINISENSLPNPNNATFGFRLSTYKDDLMRTYSVRFMVDSFCELSRKCNRMYAKIDKEYIGFLATNLKSGNKLSDSKCRHKNLCK